MSRESFMLFKSFYEPIKGLTNEQKGKLFDAIFIYQIEKTEPTDIEILPYFLFFKNQFRLDDIKYDAVVQRNKINGSKGGRGKTQKTHKNPKNPVGNLGAKKADNDNEKDNDNDNVKEKDIIYPTVEEIKIYFKENGYKIEAAVKFYNYYSVSNWKDANGKKVKNWKQKAQAVWFKDENRYQEPKKDYSWI